MERERIARELLKVARLLVSKVEWRKKRMPREYKDYSNQIGKLRSVRQFENAPFAWDYIMHENDFKEIFDYFHEMEEAGIKSMDFFTGGSFHEYWEEVVFYKDNTGKYPFTKSMLNKNLNIYMDNAIAAWEMVRNSEY